MVNLTVTAAPVPVASIEFTPALPTEPIELVIGKTYQFHAKAMPDDATSKKLNFTTSDNSIALLQDEGNSLVRADRVGEATVTVTVEDNPNIKREVKFVIKKPPEIKIETKEFEIDSNTEHPTFAVQTLHGKLGYTVEVASNWLKFDSKDSTTSKTEDTIRLTAQPNKTVWERTAYIKFKDANGKSIKITGSNGKSKDLEVKFTQKKNEHPVVTIKWVYGIGEPAQGEKEAIPVPIPGQAKRFYWDDDKIFFWNETTTTKWFNNRKLSSLSISASDGGDTNQCWAKTSVNMLHWWFEQNKKNIDTYIKNKSETEKAKYQHYYKRELEDDKEKEKSYIANVFRTRAHNSKMGDYANGGISGIFTATKVYLQRKRKRNPLLLRDRPCSKIFLVTISRLLRLRGFTAKQILKRY